MQQRYRKLRILLLLTAAFLFISYSACAQSSAYNYVVTYTPRIAITATNTLQTQTVANVNQTVQYFDGLGRPIQVVQTKGSSSQRDLVTPMAYDQFGREGVKYLPYVDTAGSSNYGTYKVTAIASQKAFYANPTLSTWAATGVTQSNFPTANTAFEPSPLNRPIEQGFDGDNWQLTGTTGATNPGHTVKLVYASNSSSSLPGYWARNYSVNYLYTYDGVYEYKNSLVDNGAYPTNTLYVTVTKNENWSSSQTNQSLNTTEEYKDLLGRIVLKRTFNYNTATSANETMSTYYVYDGNNNLTYVLPPSANPDSGSVSQQKLDNLCYQYRYDGRNRMIGKKIPGKGWQWMIYNRLDQLVATQDSVQRMFNPQRYSFIKYDSQGREIISGYFAVTADNVPGVDNRASIQSAVDAQTVFWETKSTSGTYSNVTYPTTSVSTLMTNYYDDYVNAFQPTNYTAPTGSSVMTRGLLTATSKVNLTTVSDLLWKVNYYDDLGRVTNSYSQHYLGGHTGYTTNNYDLVTNTYLFTNQLYTTIRAHYNYKSTSVPAVIIENTYDYDAVGRSLHNLQQITGKNGTAQTQTYLSFDSYNQIGQLYTRQFNLPSGSSTYTSEVSYLYNERGWVTNHTAIPSGGFFNEQIYYNSPTGGATAQYNGNISQFIYNSPYMESNNGQSPNAFNTVNYTYDNVNRLTQSASTLQKTDETVSYDLEGNIKQLTRNGSYAGTYVYTYPGQSNLLSSVKRNSYNPMTYAYDGNGNITTDSATITITYNLLNLPGTVKKGSATLATYLYAADGDKLRDVSTSNGTWDYDSGIVYENGQIQFIQNSEGRNYLIGDSVTYNYNYDIKDYLGNVRGSYDNGGTGGASRLLQENDYYPFGLSVLAYDYANNNRYLYNGKELQQDLTNKYDYGARFYDAYVARWKHIDSKAELYFNINPYAYAANTPTNAIDPNGHLVIFVAGMNTGNGKSSSYWGGFDKAVMQHFNDYDKRANQKQYQYYDGALGGVSNTLAYSFPIQESTEKYDNLNVDDRIAAGKERGDYDAKGIIESLQRTNGVITESIKIIAHSMGAAYAKGLIEAIVAYAKEHPEECRGLRITEYDFAAFQQNDLSAIPGVTLFQFDNNGDDVVGGIIGLLTDSSHAKEKGSETKGSNNNVNPNGGHAILDFINAISGMQEGKWVNEGGTWVKQP